MDEMRVREIFAQHLLSQASESVHCLSHAQSEFSHTPSHATSWLLGDLPHNKLSELTAENIQRPTHFVAENFQECTTVRPDSFIRKNSYNDVNFLSSSIKGNETSIVDLELPADMYHDDQGKQFKEGNLFAAPELTCKVPMKLPNFQPASDSDFGSVKAGDLSSFNLNSGKTNCFIDLNEPLQFESLPSSSSGPLETYTCHTESLHNDPCVSVEAIQESVVPKHCRLLNCDDSSDGVNSSVAIDLNSMPVSCFSEMEISLENLWSMNKETAVVLDCSSACNHAMRKEKRAEDHPVVHNKINNKFLKTETCIDLNNGIVDEHSPPVSSSILQIKSAEDTELEGPVSPENEECSPPRGESEDIQLETPLLSEQGEGEPSVELDTIAAQTLVMVSSSGVQEYKNAVMAEPLVNFGNCLRWFAEIVSSTGDDLENEVMRLHNDTADNDQGELLSHGLYRFGASTPKLSEENAVNFSYVKKEKETGTLSRSSGKGHTRGTKQSKDFQTEAQPFLNSLSKDLHTIEGFLETGPLRRKAGSKACAKPRKYSKLYTSDVVKKSMSSILKQPATRSKQGVLQGWGKIRKRQGGRRRRASKFLLISGVRLWE